MGRGIAIDCGAHDGIHYWNDYLYFELLTRRRARVLPKGRRANCYYDAQKAGRAACSLPVRTITRIIWESVRARGGTPHGDRIVSRTTPVGKGVNIFSGQIDDIA